MSDPVFAISEDVIPQNRLCWLGGERTRAKGVGKGGSSKGGSKEKKKEEGVGSRRVRYAHLGVSLSLIIAHVASRGAERHSTRRAELQASLTQAHSLPLTPPPTPPPYPPPPHTRQRPC